MESFKSIRVSFPLFNLEDSQGCEKDYFKIEMDNTYSETYCGSFPPAEMVLNGTITFTLKTNGKIGGRFKIVIGNEKFVKPPFCFRF